MLTILKSFFPLTKIICQVDVKLTIMFGMSSLGLLSSWQLSSFLPRNCLETGTSGWSLNAGITWRQDVCIYMPDDIRKLETKCERKIS